MARQLSLGCYSWLLTFQTVAVRGAVTNYRENGQGEFIHVINPQKNKKKSIFALNLHNYHAPHYKLEQKQGPLY